MRDYFSNDVQCSVDFCRDWFNVVEIIDDYKLYNHMSSVVGAPVFDLYEYYLERCHDSLDYLGQTIEALSDDGVDVHLLDFDAFVDFVCVTAGVSVSRRMLGWRSHLVFSSVGG